MFVRSRKPWPIDIIPAINHHLEFDLGTQQVTWKMTYNVCTPVHAPSISTGSSFNWLCDKSLEVKLHSLKEELRLPKISLTKQLVGNSQQTHLMAVVLIDWRTCFCSKEVNGSTRLSAFHLLYMSFVWCTYSPLTFVQRPLNACGSTADIWYQLNFLHQYTVMTKETKIKIIMQWTWFKRVLSLYYHRETESINHTNPPWVMVAVLSPGTIGTHIHFRHIVATSKCQSRWVAIFLTRAVSTCH